jgi:Type II secretion system protein B
MVDVVTHSVTRASALLVALGLSAAPWAAGVVDPTRPPPGYGAPQQAGDPQRPDPPPEAVRLQMVARDGSQRMAVLNGHRVRPGDAIALDGKSVRVVAIRDDSIVLDRDGHRQMVELTPHVRLK